jgi:hypothetical protein
MNNEENEQILNDEENVETVAYSKKQPEPEVGSARWALQWSYLLIVVFLAGSAINCLFRWLAYGYSWDGAGTLLSASLSLVVYFFSLTTGRIGSLEKRTVLAFASIATWAVALPIIFRLLGFKG